MVVTDINAIGAQTTADLIIGAWAGSISLAHDTADLEAHERAVASAVEHIGALTLAVNNAGIATSAGPIGEMDQARGTGWSPSTSRESRTDSATRSRRCSPQAEARS